MNSARECHRDHKAEVSNADTKTEVFLNQVQFRPHSCNAGERIGASFVSAIGRQLISFFMAKCNITPNKKPFFSFECRYLSHGWSPSFESLLRVTTHGEWEKQKKDRNSHLAKTRFSFSTTSGRWSFKFGGTILRSDRNKYAKFHARQCSQSGIQGY